MMFNTLIYTDLHLFYSIIFNPRQSVSLRDKFAHRATPDRSAKLVPWVSAVWNYSTSVEHSLQIRANLKKQSQFAGGEILRNICIYKGL